MAKVYPFAALRPKAEWAEKICELPYDVMSSAEARALAKDNPLSFLHVSKPEIDLPDSVDPYSAPVYAKGRENFERLIAQGALHREAQPCIYLYRQVMGGHSQTGIVAAASCEDYLQGIIKKHEFTRPDKEDDRVRHIEALNAQTGPAFLVYRAVPALDELIARETTGQPDTDFTAPDGVRHTSWTIRDAAAIQFIGEQFAKLPCLYIADGHHRSAAAARACQARKGAGASGVFLNVIFAHHQTQILPYNRVLKDLNGLNAAQMVKKLEEVFGEAPLLNALPARSSQGEEEEASRRASIRADRHATPSSKHSLCFYFEGRWRTLRFKRELTLSSNPVERLDASLLQRHVLAPIFGIDDPRTSKRINFVGGIRGTAELEKLVTSGEYACAFSMFPTDIGDLMSVADAGGIMPPKSTWFEPKLRDGMFSLMI